MRKEAEAAHALLFDSLLIMSARNLTPVKIARIIDKLFEGTAHAVKAISFASVLGAETACVNALQKRCEVDEAKFRFMPNLDDADEAKGGES